MQLISSHGFVTYLQQNLCIELHHAEALEVEEGARWMAVAAGRIISPVKQPSAMFTGEGGC